MLLYYTQRVKDKKITNILTEATNKYIENIKEQFRLRQSIGQLSDNDNSNDTHNYSNYNHNDNGLLLFVSFISFICGYSCGRKCIQ